MKSKMLPFCLLLFISTTQSVNLHANQPQKVIANKKDTTIAFDFVKSGKNIQARKSGIITMEVYYSLLNGKFSNDFGRAKVYMIHRNGGEWWVEQAKMQFPNLDAPLNRRVYYAVWDMTEKIFEDKKSNLKDYDKWAFFVDKKYLDKTVQDGEVDFDNPSFGKPQPILYDVKDDIEYEEVLYEQKAGSDVWVRVSSRKFGTGDKHSSINNNDIWGESLIEKKLLESNQKAKR